MEDAIIRKRKFSLKGDKAIWIIVLLLCLISILAVYSSSSALAYREGKSMAYYLFKQSRFVILGLSALMACYIVHPNFYKRIAQPAFLITCGLLFLTIFIGKEINGATRWLEIGPLSFQPSELAKITIVLYLAKVIEAYDLSDFKTYAIRVLIPIGVMLALIMVGSVSVTIVLGILSLSILIIAGIKWSHIWKTALIAVAAMLAFIGINSAFHIFPRFETAVSRVVTFVSADEKDESRLTEAEKQRNRDKTFQADMAKKAVSEGKLFGKGPGNSNLKNMLPHAYSDFIYAIIIEEGGLIFGAIPVLMLYIWFYFRCFSVAKKCRMPFSALTVAGLGLMITLQAILHMFVNLGITPVTGHTLPMISLGGTSYIILSCAFGIILSISRVTEKQNLVEGEQDFLNVEYKEENRERLPGRQEGMTITQ